MNVKFTYKHDIVGTHRLPVILKIQNGSITESKNRIKKNKEIKLREK